MVVCADNGILRKFQLQNGCEVKGINLDGDVGKLKGYVRYPNGEFTIPYSHSSHAHFRTVMANSAVPRLGPIGIEINCFHVSFLPIRRRMTCMISSLLFIRYLRHAFQVGGIFPERFVIENKYYIPHFLDLE